MLNMSRILYLQLDSVCILTIYNYWVLTKYKLRYLNSYSVTAFKKNRYLDMSGTINRTVHDLQAEGHKSL